MKPAEALLASVGRSGAVRPDGTWLTVAAPATVAAVAAHPSAVRDLQAALAAPRAAVLVSGPPGSCKSTLLRCALAAEGRATVLDGAAEGAPAVARAVQEVRRGETRVGVVVENADSPGVAAAASAALRKTADGRGAGCVVLVVQQRFGTAGRTLAGACGSDVRFPPVPTDRAVYAVAQAARAAGAALTLEDVRRSVAYGDGDLRKALIDAEWWARGATSSGDAVRMPRDAFEAVQRLLEAGPDTDLCELVQGADPELCAAMAADRGLRAARGMRAAARTSLALSDDDAAHGARPGREAALRRVRAGVRRQGARGGFPPAAAFGRRPALAQARARAHALFDPDVLDFFVTPVALSDGALPRAAPASLPAELVNAVRRGRGRLARFRAAMVHARRPDASAAPRD